jgi:hypothetical protein
MQTSALSEMSESGRHGSDIWSAKKECSPSMRFNASSSTTTLEDTAANYSFGLDCLLSGQWPKTIP